MRNQNNGGRIRLFTLIVLVRGTLVFGEHPCTVGGMQDLPPLLCDGVHRVGRLTCVAGRIHPEFWNCRTVNCCAGQGTGTGDFTPLAPAGVRNNNTIEQERRDFSR